MTLDDIRARDAADIPITLDMTGADWRRALWQVAADRRTLLGMLEPSAIPDHEPCCACCSEVDRLTEDRDYWETLAGDALPYPEKDVLAERARIAAEIRGLRSWGSVHSCWDDHEGPDGTHLDGSPCADYEREVVDRAAVRAIVEGEG